jgi:hypothetical protein
MPEPAPSRLAEVTQVHTQLLRVTLEPEHARAYWRFGDPTRSVDEETHAAFSEFWFGSKSMTRVRKLILTFRQRFGAYPEALHTLRAWTDIDRDSRILVAHWHLQLTDPIYRRFSGDFLPERRYRTRPEITRDVVLTWVSDVDRQGGWSAATRTGFASKLLSAAHAAGLVGAKQDPRPLTIPRVPSSALAYLLYFLRTVDFKGSLHDNPYLRSVGLEGGLLDDRLRTSDAVTLRRVGDVVDFTWTHPTLLDWGGQTPRRKSAQP